MLFLNSRFFQKTTRCHVLAAKSLRSRQETDRQHLFWQNSVDKFQFQISKKFNTRLQLSRLDHRKTGRYFQKLDLLSSTWLLQYVARGSLYLAISVRKLLQCAAAFRNVLQSVASESVHFPNSMLLLLQYTECNKCCSSQGRWQRVECNMAGPPEKSVPNELFHLFYSVLALFTAVAPIQQAICYNSCMAQLPKPKVKQWSWQLDA